jgi:hypothetical protein
MRLNEIKTVSSGEISLTEGVIPIHLQMSLEQVVSAGKVTNNVQHFILAGLAGMFRDGGPYRWPRDINGYPMSTSSEMLEAIKNLSPAEAVDFSAWLLEKLNNVAEYEATRIPAQLETVDWIRYVLKKQD